MVPYVRKIINKKLEETIGLINFVSLTILQDFKKSPESIGLKPSPLESFTTDEVVRISEED